MRARNNILKGIFFFSQQIFECRKLNWHWTSCLIPGNANLQKRTRLSYFKFNITLTNNVKHYSIVYYNSENWSVQQNTALWNYICFEKREKKKRETAITFYIVLPIFPSFKDSDVENELIILQNFFSDQMSSASGGKRRRTSILLSQSSD